MDKKSQQNRSILSKALHDAEEASRMGMDNRNHKTSSPKKKSSNLSYRSSRPASKKQASSDHKSIRSREAVSAEYTQLSEDYMPNRKRRPPVTDESPKGKKRHHSDKKGRKKKKGCFFYLILLLILIAALFFAMRTLMGSAFDQIEKYQVDYEQVSINNYDENIGDYINIALFGVDNQDNKIYDKGSRTDCIIVASINKRNKDVKLMSIYRDTYVSIDGKYDKINAAYAYGGPELAISTINRNLDLNITDFATVNFKALADAVDELGGITLTVKSEKERKNLNDYIGNMNHINGGNSPKFDEPEEYPFTATFDGNQAVAYSRIRYMAGGDHERANHQRLVVEGIMNSVKKKPWKLKRIIDVVLPQCKTSLSSDTMLKLSLALPRYTLVDSQAYPFHSQDEKYNGIYYGFPLTTYSNTVEAHKYLFGTEDYEPTEELQRISEKVKIVTDDIGLY